MQLTNLERVGKLGGNLLRYPFNIGRYLSQNVFRRRSPLDLELPWFSYGAIDFLEKFLRPDMHVFEFGSGGSTIFFARRCASVRSVEEHPEWAARVRQRAAQIGLTNAVIMERPFDFGAPAGFLESEYLAQVREASFDVIVVDGADNDYTIRPKCFHAAENQVKPGGIIVVDDSWRYRELRDTHRARRVEIFETVGPWRYGVTSTDIYLY
jgi:predicted O-methyltransferase YrrM